MVSVDMIHVVLFFVCVFVRDLLELVSGLLSKLVNEYKIVLS
jgi:hypothetical protein